MDSLRLPAHTRGPGVVVVELNGELDVTTAPILGAALTRIPSSPSGPLVLLDLSRLDFCDVAGLRVMAVSAQRLAGRGARLALVAPRRHFMRLLEAARLDGCFEAFPSLRAAEASSAAPSPLRPRVPA